MKVPVRQIAEAVERQGGDMEDVRDLVYCFERLHGQLADANVAYNAGDALAAEATWKQLEAEFSKPLDEVVRDHLERER
jgi:hypothetical protein